MSELYSVEVEQVHAGEVVFRVTTIHPDAGPPREQATFPMKPRAGFSADHPWGRGYSPAAARRSRD